MKAAPKKISGLAIKMHGTKSKKMALKKLHSVLHNSLEPLVLSLFIFKRNATNTCTMLCARAHKENKHINECLTKSTENKMQWTVNAKHEQGYSP